MKKVIHHVLRGKRYKIKRVPCRELQDAETKRLKEVCWGSCSPPTKKGKSIRIADNLSGKEELRTFLHELCHANFWDLEETAIDDATRDMADLLWRVGYRKVE